MLMMQEKALHGDSSATVRDVVQRRDESTARTIDRGIGLQHSVSTMCAMEYLHSEGISNLIAQRVLSQPSKRRCSVKS